MKRYHFYYCFLSLLFSCTIQRSVTDKRPRDQSTICFYYSPTQEFKLRLDALQKNSLYEICIINGMPYTSLSLVDSTRLNGKKPIAKMPANDVRIKYIYIDPLKPWVEPVVFRSL